MGELKNTPGGTLEFIQLDENEGGRRDNIHGNITKGFVAGGFKQELVAAKITQLIIDGKIPHIKILY